MSSSPDNQSLRLPHTAQFFLRGFLGPESSARGKRSTWSNVKQSATNSILATIAVNRKITAVHLGLYLTKRIRFTKQDGSRTTVVSEEN